MRCFAWLGDRVSKGTAAALPVMALAAVLPLAAQWQPIGALKPGAPEANAITFRGMHSVAAITVLAPDLVRVRIARGASFGPDESWAVVKPAGDWPKTTADFEAGANGDDRVIRTAELEVRVKT